ncbi:hypothetical protein [Vibrio splendidus]|uniref:hypothetical protein n=1 Tax=Vibrio splendidus TaxID=29497 RepID=UPI000C81ADEB|nr:hypothetical protein [Vibrio splendidus]PMK06282.1 hypothetical protein BCU08_17190 [Vibrio splendidus]
MKKVTFLVLGSIAMYGCGDDYNVQLSQPQKDVDFSQVKVYHLADTAGTLYSPEIEKQFKAIGIAADLEGTMQGLHGEASDYKLEELKVIREKLTLLPVSEELKVKFDTDLDLAEEQAEKIYKHYVGKYSDGNVEKAYRHKYPEYFAKIDASEKNLAERNAYLSESKKEYDNLGKQVKAKSNELEAYREKGLEVARKFFIKNELTIPLSNTNFQSYSYTYLDKNAENCSSDNRYNAEYRVCYTIGFANDGNGLRSRDEQKLTSAQLDTYNASLMPLFSDMNKLAEEHAILKVRHKKAEGKLKKETILADNQFGTERDARRAFEDARRSLNHKTVGGYSTHSGIITPDANKYNRSHNRVFDEVAKELDLYAVAPLSSFNAENAYKIFQNLAKSTDEKLVEINVNDKGRLEIPVTQDGEPAEGIFLIKYPTSKSAIEIGKLSFGYPNKDGHFKARSQFTTAVDSTSMYYLDRAGSYDLRFNNSAGIEEGDSLKDFAKHLSSRNEG